MPVGRPSLPYDPYIADLICERIATSTLGMADVLTALASEGVDVPSASTVYRWLAASEEFRQNSARARELQGDTLVDLAMKHALEPLVGTTTTSMEWGEQVKTGDNVQRSQLIVQTILKRAGQLAPKKYGDLTKIEHSGSVDVTFAQRLERALERTKE